MIRLDPSTTSIVVTCSQCPHWHAFQWTREAALVSAAEHERACHDLARGHHRKALDQYRYKHRRAPRPEI